MMELLVLGALVMSIMALVKASDALKRAEALEQRQRELAQHSSVAQWPALSTAASLEDVVPPPSPVALPGPEIKLEQAAAPVAPLPVGAHTTPPPLPKPAAVPPVLKPTAPALSFEQFLGAKLFAWLGGLALFLGVVYFVKYAFERNMIPPAVRCGLGFATGTALTLVGLWLKDSKRYTVMAQSLAATGVLVLYGVTFAAHALYQFPLFTTGSTFALMSVVTVVAILLAVRMDSQVVAVLGIIGGFLTPPLCSTGQDNPVALFSYIALLDIGVLVLAQRKSWQYLAPLAVVGTLLMQFGWVLRFVVFGHAYEASDKGWIIVAVFAGFAWLFSAAAAACKRRDPKGLAVALSALALALSAMLMAFLLLDHAISTPPVRLYTFVLLINGSVLWVAWQHRALLWAQTVVGALTFLHMALWTGIRLNADLLVTALGVYLVFGLLHSLFAVLTQRHALTIARAVWMPFALLIIAIFNVALPDPALVFGFAALLSVLLLIMATRLQQPVLPLASVLSVLAVEVCWHGEHFSGDAVHRVLFWYLGFLALFTLFPFLTHRTWTEKKMPWIAACVASIGTFLLWHVTLVRIMPEAESMGLLPAAFIFLPLLGLLWIRKQHTPDNPARMTQLAWFGGTALLFLTLVFPVQFGKESLTLGWALEGAALCWLFLRVPHTGLRYTALGLLTVAFARLALNPAVLTYHERSGAPVINWFLYTYGLVACAMFAAAWFLKPPHDKLGELNLRGLFCAFGGVLLFLLMNIEIADAFTVPSERFVTFQFYGNLARDMTYTIAWSLFALALLGLGFWTRTAATRYTGIGLLGVALLKLFFHDLAGISGIYRIGALMVVAVIAFAASFLYQRFAERAEK